MFTRNPPNSSRSVALAARSGIKPTIRWVAAIAGIVIPICAAQSQELNTHEPTFRPSYGACVKAAAGVTLALNNCIGAEHAFQDKRLNTVYHRLRKTLPASVRIKLRDQERAWIAQRDKTCKADHNGGTASLLDANQCQLDETATRAAVLEGRLGR